MSAPWLSGSMKLGRTWMKVERAAQHLVELRGQIARIERAPFEIVEDRDVATADRIWLMRPTAAANALLGVSMYGVIIGDFVHNLRSGLDHAVWKLAKPPGRSSAFPICLHERDAAGSFKGGPDHISVGKKRLRNVDQAAFDYIESMQPYNRFGERDPLWQLNELWNEDKHRTLLVIADPTWTTPVMIATRDGRDTYAGELKERDATNPAEVFRLDAQSDSVVTFALTSKVEIRFASPAVVARQPVVSKLDWMLRYTTTVLMGLENFL